MEEVRFSLGEVESLMLGIPEEGAWRRYVEVSVLTRNCAARNLPIKRNMRIITTHIFWRLSPLLVETI
jgi:hypothetical protein